MKNPKKPKRLQKMIMDAAGLDATEYLVINETDSKLTIISKKDKSIKELDKPEKVERRR